MLDNTCKTFPFETSKHKLKPKSYKIKLLDCIKSDFINNFCPEKDLNRLKNTNAIRKKSLISAI